MMHAVNLHCPHCDVFYRDFLPTTGCWICGEHGVINDALYNQVVESVGRGHAWSYAEATA